MEGKISKQEADKKNNKSHPNNEQDNDNEQDQDQDSLNSSEYDSFVVADDVQDSYQDDDYDSDKQKKKKKKKKDKDKDKKKDKKKKKRARRDSDDSVIADDLDVIQAAQQKLTRLKKNRDKAYNQNQDDQFQQQEEDDNDLEAENQQYDLGYGHDYDQESYPSQYQNKRQQQLDLNDLLDQRVRKQFFADTTDRQIVEMDLPQRQIIKYKNYAKITDTLIDTIQKDFQAQDRVSQAKWIYQRLRQNGNFQVHDERECIIKIQNVLTSMHRQHLDIMYIYYYRKKMWENVLNLNLLMKIQQIDQQWMTFKKQFKTLKDDITAVIPSFHQVPRSLQQALNTCTDVRQLKYFKQYTSFIMSKRKSDIQIKSSNKKLNIIRQICDKGIDLWLTQKQPFLSPHHFCLNIRNRMQDKKPLTPHNPPDKVLRKLLRQNHGQFAQSHGDRLAIDQKQQQIQDKRRDWSNYPLLSPDKRITTLICYLAIQLFNYPQMRKILKQKYYKKLLITTTPTIQGSHIINIYNSFFPVKRIKDKPVVSMKKQMWILARQAQKLGLITIQLKFQWQLSSTQKKNYDGDPVYGEMVKNYFDLNSQSSGDSWNLLRKQVLVRMLADHFFPAFMEQIKEDLTRQGTKQIIQSCCQKFRNQLNKGPSFKKQGEPIKILAMVLQNQKLGIAFVDEHGKQHSPLCIQLKTDDQLKRFISDQILSKLIEDYHPDMILVSANCRRAQTLRKQLRNPNLFSQPVYCAFGEYQVPSLMANKNIIQGVSSQKCILQAISMARMKKNPMAQILGLWSDNLEQNGVYSMNLHPLQKYINKRKLIDALQKVAIQIVNLVGVDIDDIRNSDHCRNVLQFVSGLGPRKAFDLIQKVKQKYPPTRKHLLDIVKSTYVYVNCSPFIKFQRQQHLQMIQRIKNNYKQQTKKQKKYKNKDLSDKAQINLLDMTRIPEQWYALTQKLFVQTIKASNIIQFKHKKNASDQQVAVRQMFKHPQRLRNVEWESKKDQNRFYDQALVKAQIMNNFKDPRDPQKVMQNRDIFYCLLKQTPETLRKFMVVTVRVLNVNNQYLNVVIPQNGLFGFIKLPSDRNNDRGNNQKSPQYEKGMFIKAVITGFPFDQRRHRDRQQGDQQQQLLKVDMSLNFPHRSQDKAHDCQRLCFPFILKQIHPNIDLDKQTFDLSKQTLPVVEVREEPISRPKTQFKRISHPKFKNINLSTAIQQVKELKIGDFIIRPSNQGNNFLTITWHFYKGIITHIKLKCQQRIQSGNIYVYRVLDKAKDKVYQSIDEIIQRYLKPMNSLVQDVISNKKFLPIPIQQIQQKVKLDASRQQAYIQYYFGCSPQYPQFFILVYLYKQKKPTKELIRVKNDGLHFHEQVFHTLRELINFFKENLKDRKYQGYARSNALKK